MQVQRFANKYSQKSQKNGIVPYDKIKATEKWVEYSLDLIEMSKMLTIVTAMEKFVLLAAIAVAERKRDYMYRHPNFQLGDASFALKRARRLLKI